MWIAKRWPNQDFEYWLKRDKEKKTVYQILKYNHITQEK